MQNFYLPCAADGFTVTRRCCTVTIYKVEITFASTLVFCFSLKNGLKVGGHILDVS